MKNKLMTHVVAGYPTPATCIELLLGMQQAGVCAVEVQVPFSDPNADGPAIMKANDVALQNGMTVEKCFQMIHSARKKGLNIPVYIMSYVNKLHSFGIEEFCQQAQSCQIAGFIIPDLPFDTPEYKSLASLCNKYQLSIVPVLSPGATSQRIQGYQLETSQLVYVTSMHGVTGSELNIQDDLRRLTLKIRSVSSCKIAVGFGIRTPDHVRMALEVADVAVVGSEVIRTVEQQGISKTVNYVRRLTQA